MQPIVKVIESDNDRLVFSYSVTNDWGREIFLFNRLFTTDRTGKRTVDPNHLYVSVSGTTLQVAKTLIPVPEAKEVEYPDVPYMTRLESGDSFEETVELTLPIREHHPYRYPALEKAADHEIVCEQLVFILGYFRPPDPDWVRRVELDGNTELSTGYGRAIQAFDSVASAPVQVQTRCIVVTPSAK